MATIPGTQFNITGASGSQGLLGPKSGWKVYVLPRGAYASAASTALAITTDSAGTAARFAANNWVQVGTDTSKIRKVTQVIINRVMVNSAVVVSENDRIFLIGNTQPSVVGGSATYIIPQTNVYYRDDDASDKYTNSMVTSNSDGLVQFYAPAAVYDCIIQDGNQSNQGYIANIAVGAVEGISTGDASVFGGTVTINAALGVTGWVTLGQSVTVTGALGVTGTATFGVTTTVHGALGVTGTGIFGATLTASGSFVGSASGSFGNTLTVVGMSGNYSHTGWATFGNTITITGALGVTGTVAAGATSTLTGIANTGNIYSTGELHTDKIYCSMGTVPSLAASAGWGSSAVLTEWGTNCDQSLGFMVYSAGSAIGASPTIVATFGGAWTGVASPRFHAVATRAFYPLAAYACNYFQPTVPFLPTNAIVGESLTLVFWGTPVAGETYGCSVILMGTSTQ